MVINKHKIETCKEIAKKALEMNDPCIQITPVFSNTHVDWVKIYYIISEMTKKVEANLNQPFLVKITETNFHEDAKNENFKQNVSNIDTLPF